ncbi:MAG: hypothetical protein OHK0013_49430 [Sandaracinaceae bacterium]
MTFWQWKAWVTPEKVKAHWAWYERGKQGEGRLVVEGRDLRGIERIRALDGARFVRCDLSHAQLPSSLLDEIELVECNLDDSTFSWSSMQRAQFDHSTFRRANFAFAKLNGAFVEGGSFAQMNAEKSTWYSVQARGADFRGARLSMARLNDAIFEDCDFRDAQLVRSDPEADGGTAWSARFINCDFTGADVTGWLLRATRFEGCKLAGSRGKPSIGEPLVLRGNDLSEVQLNARWR